MTDIEYAEQRDQPPVNGDLMASMIEIGSSDDAVDVETLIQAVANVIGYRAALLGEPMEPRLARLREIAGRAQALNLGAAGRA